MLLIFSSCNEDNQIKESPKSNNEESSLVANYHNLSFEIKLSDHKIVYNAELLEDLVTSTFTITNEEEKPVVLEYDFNTGEEHWKLRQDKSVVEKARDLISQNVKNSLMIEIMDALESFYEINYQTLEEGSSSLLVSSISYHQSILATASTSIIEEKDCECTVHPAFLVDKTYFNCQEEQFYEVGALKEILKDYGSQNSKLDYSTLSLINFLNQTDEKVLRFDDFYSFFISKDDFAKKLSQFKNKSENVDKGDCAWWCPIGCGSSHGCCGNYSGCCLYAHVLCYVHDRACTNCRPPEFCGPACRADQ